jgi:hypothetical protein
MSSCFPLHDGRFQDFPGKCRVEGETPKEVVLRFCQVERRYDERTWGKRARIHQEYTPPTIAVTSGKKCRAVPERRLRFVTPHMLWCATGKTLAMMFMKVHWTAGPLQKFEYPDVSLIYSFEDLWWPS